MRKKIFMLFVFMTMVGLIVVLPVFSQDTTTVWQGNRLLGVLFKLEKMRDDAVAQKAKAESTIVQAQAIINRARQKKDTRTEQVAQQALAVARETKAKAEWRIKRTDEAIASVRNLAARMTGNDEVRAVVTGHSGNVQYFSKKLNRSIQMDDSRAGLLEPGDEVWTFGDGSAHLKFLDGRAGLSLGPYSKIRVEEENREKEMVNLLEGKIYLAVDKLEDQHQWLEEKIRSYKEDVATITSAAEQETAEAYGKLQAMMRKKKFEIRTPSAVCAVRGTRFQVIEENTGTEVIVFEGAVDLSAVNGQESILVEAGYKALVSPDGHVSDPQVVDIRALEKWWPDE